MGEVIAEFVMQLHSDGSVTNAGFRAGTSEVQVQVPAPRPGGDDDPWAGIDATPAQQPAAQQWQPPAQGWGQPPAQYVQPQAATPACMHGPLKAVAGGISGPNSKNPGRPYPPFWACQAPQGQQKCRLDQKQLPPVPA